MSAESGPRFPEPSLQTIVYTMATQALIALGEVENPMTKQRGFDERQATWHVGSLQILLERTRGNLSDAEDAMLRNVIAELRIKLASLEDGASNEDDVAERN